jgi:phage tail sheath protein FI
MEFLHGVETVTITEGPRPIRQVRTAVIGLVVTAPIHRAPEPAAPNEVVRLLSDRDEARVFGSLPPFGGFYTSRPVLEGIWDQGGVTVFAVNIFDPAVHRESVAGSSRPILNGEIALDDQDLLEVTVSDEGDPPNVAEPGVDYEVDLGRGVITVLPGGILSALESATVAYVRAAPELVDEEAIIGDIVDGRRTGAQALLDAAPRYGFGPKILIAPGFYPLTAPIIGAFRVLADKLKAMAYLDAGGPDTSRDDVIEGRGSSGTIDLTPADGRVVYCYPWLEKGDSGLPLSVYLAGVTAATDAQLGYWRSPSNRPIVGPTRPRAALTASVSDPQSDVNQLNAAGIVTVFSGYALGLRTWGNRSSLFPGENGILTFIACQRVIDMVDESVELAALNHLDGPIGGVLVEAVLADVNEFIRLLIGRGALLPGSRVEYFDADNPPSQLSDGHIVFTRTICPPPPAERITYRSRIDINLLQLGG